MKVAYLGSDRVRFEYETMDELRDEVDKYDIHIGDIVMIGDDALLCSGVTIGPNVILGSGVTIGPNARIDRGVTIGDYSYIGGDRSIAPWSIVDDGVVIGPFVSISYGVVIGGGSKIYSHVDIPARIKVPRDSKITRLINVSNAYRYNTSAFVHDGELYIAMGCCTRKKTEWDGDFWNNELEFPKHSKAGQERLDAYNRICKMAKIEFEKELNYD